MVKLNPALQRYCLDYGLTCYEVFCKSYADFVGKPLSIENLNNLRVQADMYVKKGIGPPHHVLRFLERHRRHA